MVRDQGYFSVGLHLLLKLVDVNFLALLLSYLAHTSTEYKKLVSERKDKRS